MTAAPTAPGTSSTATPAPPAVSPSLPAASLLVGTRVVLWIGVQLLVAGVIVVLGAPGSGRPINAAAGWWMVYGSIIDLATLALVLGIVGRNNASYRSLLGPPAAPWQVGLGAIVVLAATLPAIVFSSELTAALYGPGATPPMMSIVDVPMPAAIFSATIWPVLAELAEPVAYFGIVLPALERWSGRPWIAGPLLVMLWAVEHAFFPLLTSEGALDLVFGAYRVASVLPFLAMWTALYYAFGRRLLPLMFARWIFNGGTAVAVAAGVV